MIKCHGYLVEACGEKSLSYRIVMKWVELSMRDVKGWQMWIHRKALMSVTSECRLLPRCWTQMDVRLLERQVKR